MQLQKLNARAIALAALMFAGSAAPAEAAIQVKLEVEPQRLSIIDQFTIVVAVSGTSDEVPAPQIPEDGFKIVGSNQGSQTSIVNGRVSQSYRFQFIARPTRSGTLRIPPVKVLVGGKEYASPQGAAVEVREISRREDFLLELECSRAKLYVDQEFTVTLRIRVQRLPSPHQDYDPSLPFQAGPWTHLSIPWFEKLDGFETEDVEAYARKFQPSRGAAGFFINSYSVQDFFDRERLRFTLARAAESRKDAAGKDQSYFVYTLEKRFRAAKTGSFQLAPVVAQGEIVKVRADGKVGIEKFQALSNAADVEVLDVPRENRPPAFTGGIGRFSISAALVNPKETVWVGEPLTLKLTVAGEGRFETIGPPSLKEQKAVTDRFRVAEESAVGDIDAERRSKTFTYSIRPNSATVTEVPAVQLAYFDPEKEGYVTVESNPIPIHVEEGQVVTSGDVESFQGDPFVRSHKRVGSIVYANIEGPDALEPRPLPSLWSPGRLAALAAPALIYALLLAVTMRKRRLERDPSILRSRGAWKRARAVLDEGSRAFAAGRIPEAVEALSRALAGFVADRLDLSGQGLTPIECSEALERAGVDQGLRESVRRFLDGCDQARYGLAGPNALSRVEAEATAKSLLRELERALP
jgi:hypothetical protein